MHDTVIGYYDADTTRRLRAFVEGNPRIERAWETVAAWAPAQPSRILEIGCGIGDISWRMTRCWPEAEVVGLDISPKAIEIGQRLFGSPRLRFALGPLRPGLLEGTFDLIVLMDVYEHIAPGDRPQLHDALASLLAERGRVVLSFPTPRMLRWMRQHQPGDMQPVDEDIPVEQLLALARDTSSDLLFYAEQSVWDGGDYAHAVLEKRTGWAPVPVPRAPEPNLAQRLRGMLARRPERLVPTRSERLEMVHRCLGPGAYTG